mmetsp:Transcript_82039/g.171722  ORF Transcript_82039/g.171722 Transcript_82039/m.171722 type:complete len:467 (-) Transcript_82039:78-1478(-)
MKVLRFSTVWPITLFVNTVCASAAEAVLSGQALDTHGETADVDALVSDDECGLEEACSLSAIQLRGQKVASSEHSSGGDEVQRKWGWGDYDNDQNWDDDYGGGGVSASGAGGVAIGIGGIIGAIAAAAAAGAAADKNPIHHYALNCWDACGQREGFCEAYCGKGNACCNHAHRTAPECKQAKMFPVLTFHTCVKTNMAPPSGGGQPAGSQPSGGTCIDSESSCSGWAQNGECRRNPNYMKVKCCRSCQNGQAGSVPAVPAAPAQPAGAGSAAADCSDASSSCGAWAAAGECNKNPDWMKGNCKVSCKVCQLSAGTSLGSASAPKVTTMMATTTPAWATSDCQTATADNPSLKACFDSVTWVFTHGLTSNPEWFPGLTFTSPFEAVQYKMHADGKCPMPCAPTNAGCQSASDNESGECYKAVIFAKNDGIHAHPEWFPELKPESPVDDFQMHLHNQNTTLCPKPCKN